MTNQPKRLFHTIVQQLTELIDSGAFPPGARLPCERDLAERFKVSRVTIREAAVALQALGRVTVKTGSGAYVCKTPPSATAPLPVISAFELTEARALFESEAAALAAPRIEDAELDRLWALVETLTADLSRAEHDAADKVFHLTIAAASGNKVVEHMIGELWRLRAELPDVAKAYSEICRQIAEDRLDEHRAVYTALRNRDPAAARTAMRHHFQCILAKLLDASEERALREVRQQAAQSRKRYGASAALP